MELDERTRQELFRRLDDVLGPQYAEALMSYLPPVGWADVATKRDLDLMSAKFEAMLHREIGGLRSEMVKQTRGLFFALAGLMVTMSGIMLAAIRTI
jgi:hypothetical protein